MSEKPTAGKWEMVRHTAASDYGEDAYTLHPQHAIITGISEADARLIEAAPQMREALKEARLEWLMAFDTYVKGGDPAAVAVLARMDAALAAAGPDKEPVPTAMSGKPTPGPWAYEQDSGASILLTATLSRRLPLSISTIPRLPKRRLMVA